MRFYSTKESVVNQTILSMLFKIHVNSGGKFRHDTKPINYIFAESIGNILYFMGYVNEVER